VKRSTQKPTTGSARRRAAAVSAAGNKRDGPGRLADALLVRILRGDHPPGARLPPERQLAGELGVDRTTLRMALGQLARMNLITARHGSGIEVNDFRERGGLDVLAALFSLDDLPLEGSFMVEAVDFWLEMFSLTTAKAMTRMTLDDLRRIEKLLDRASAVVAEPEPLAAALIDLTDELARLSGSVLFRMLNTSTRSLLRRVTLLLLEQVDLAPCLRDVKQSVRSAALARPAEEEVRAGLLALLRGLTGPLRERLLFGDPPQAARPTARQKGRRR
jgi:GntR family transcriptional regulator, transcriptional repressor for pyruvate dehydrogenase complex